ncbi:carboxypeptidase M32 [Candidatus Microgenomates bacterium]|nr:carboxypeptidase M32 [Candidatus Microgenomates bacterium]
MIKMQNADLKKILEKYKEIYILGEIPALLGWDQNTYMPQAAAENRALQITAIEEIITNKWNNAELRSLIESLDDTVLNEVESAAIRNIRRVTKYYFKVPKKTILHAAGVYSKAFSAWQVAKQNDDFASFAPHLTEVVALKKEIAGYLGTQKNPYDALLDLYEPGLTSVDCENVFSYLQPKITSLLERITASAEYKKPISFLEKPHRYEIQKQQELSAFLLQKMTFASNETRLDESAHPFTTGIGRHDIRITTKYHEDDMRSAYAATIHEAGHGLYELGVDNAYDYSPFAGGVSLGIHESQSRFWENQIGRSPQFLQYMEPIFETLFPAAFGGATTQDILKYVNYVKPGLIRIESDEVTYNLHIMVRYEIESGLLNNTISVTEIPEVWREKMKKYLGVVPTTDREGCLQDVHWSYGDMGYFPTYCLGTLFAAQFTETMKKDIVLDNLIKTGSLAPIREWLRTHIHAQGSRYMPKEIIKRVTGEDLNPKYFVDYLEKKYSAIYAL